MQGVSAFPDFARPNARVDVNGGTTVAWVQSARGSQAGLAGFVCAPDYITNITNNLYTDGAAWRYMKSGFKGTLYQQFGGTQTWYAAPLSTAAGSPAALVTQLFLDAVGNVSIGPAVTFGWWSGLRALQLGGNGTFWADAGATGSGSLQVSQNAYFDGANWVYISTGPASNLAMVNGTHVFRTAASGTAGTAITWVTAFTIDVAGNISDAKGGVRDVPQNSQSGNYTLLLTDAGKHIFHPSADTTARTWTIPANASVAFPIGTAVTFVNQNAAGAITIAITSDTLRIAGVGSVGSRTLTANGIATALKVTATEWIISGTNLS